MSYEVQRPGTTEARRLLVMFRRDGLLIARLNKTAHVAPAKGERGLRRTAKKRRHRAHVLRLQRVSWCAHYERLKKEAQA
jgi:hypothetical protein